MEEWEAINGFEGKYEVSSKGRVKSLNYMRRGFEKILNLELCSNMRYRVSLSMKGIVNHYFISRLVAIAFIPVPEHLKHIPIDDLEVNHKDENTLNNCVENLEWCTHIENCNYGTRNKRITKNLMGKLIGAKSPRSKQVAHYDKDGNLIEKYGSQREAGRETKYNYRTIGQHIAKNKKEEDGSYWKCI